MPAKYGALIRREEDGERPAPAPPHELHHELVDLVEVRPLLAVDLDAHEGSFMSAAVPSSSNDSCSITWHQWQAA